MEVEVSENNEIIKTILIHPSKDISGMLQSIEELRQKVNVFLTEKIQGEVDIDENSDEGVSDTDEEDVKLPVTPNKRKKLP